LNFPPGLVTIRFVNRFHAGFVGRSALACLGLLLLTLAAGLPGLRAAAVEGAGPAGEARFLTNARQLIFEGKRSGEGYFSPDGRALIFQSEREPGNPFYQIYTLDFESGETRRVSTGQGKTTCSFFRPGTDEILFASTHLDPDTKARQQAELDLRASGKQRRYAWDYDEHMDIFAARRDGSALRRLTDSPGYDAEGSYSPDGRLIVFCSLRDAYPTNRLSAADQQRLATDPAWFGEIYLMNADGTNPRRLTHTPGYDGGPFFSPDGQRILWRRFDETGVNADVYTMKLDGSDVRRLTDFGAMSWAPYFHPSGRYLIFTANKLGFSNFELFLVDAEGTREPVRVTFTDGFDGLPVFSPDGNRLCWTSGRTSDGKSQLFLADWNHKAALAALAEAPARIPGGGSLVSSSPAAAASNGNAAPGITANRLREEVEFLASPDLAGRATGGPGARQAADFLATKLREAGLSPLPGRPDMFQSFEFNAGVRVVTNGNELAVTRAASVSRFQVDQDFRPLSFTANGVVDGEVMFAGYGLAVPGKPGEGYDSYAGVNVSNKIVVVLRYVPEGVSTARRAELNRYAGLRYKAMLAREHGAKAVLFVTGPNSPSSGELAALTFDSSLAGSGLVCASVTSNVVASLFAGSGRDLKALQSALDTENPHAEAGFVLSNVTVRAATQLEHLKNTDRNVLAALPPTGGGSEWVMVGAHYDHLGRGESGGTLAGKGEENQIHPGADDNASGTAAALELALALAAERRDHSGTAMATGRRGILFGFWSGEEIGLIGSSYFVEHPLLPLSNVIAYVNFDMVGRLRDNKLSLQGVGSSAGWRKQIEKRNVAAGFNLTLQDDPYLPTDVTAFYPKRVPVLNFFTGSHEEYHRPTDRPETLDYEGLARITRFARALLSDLAQNVERPDYLVVARSDAGGGSRENLRAYLGTIPDYATEVAGVKLSGVRAGGPADKGGLKAGDIIVEFGGKKIANIYDYTYAMDAAKIGEPVSVVVQRDGQRVPLKVTPEVRK
jgi:Tol biopolymer transport system component